MKLSPNKSRESFVNLLEGKQNGKSCEDPTSKKNDVEAESEDDLYSGKNLAWVRKVMMFEMCLATCSITSLI